MPSDKTKLLAPFSALLLLSATGASVYALSRLGVGGGLFWWYACLLASASLLSCALIFALSRIHARRIAETRRTSDEAFRRARESDELKAGALLHDIGKLAVPDYLLNKPGRLTAAEFEKMKVHAVVGGDIIRRVGFPYPVEEIVRHHHERWDGTGYPAGLKGEEIPLVARIISVVDFYDSTRCDRPYRAGMSRDESLALLRRMAGKSFDPSVMGAFVENVARLDSLIRSEER